MCLPIQSVKFEGLHHRPRAGARCTLLWLFCLSGLLTLLPLSGQAASAEDYLRQIETDAKRQAATPITIPAAAVSSSLDATERLPSGLKQEPFEKALSDQSIGTYVFYQRLKSEDKARVFAGYQQDNRLGTIRELTLELLSRGP